MSTLSARVHAQGSGSSEDPALFTCTEAPCPREVLACLPRAARARGDLAAFDWAAQTSRPRLATCLTHIHNVLADPARSVAWFKEAGFNAYADTRPPGHFRENQTTVHASWWGSEETFPAPRVLPWLTRILHGPIFSMAVHMDEENIVKDVQFGKAIK